ncbi:hypothetical protein HY025_00090 [Candidatus Daviesbacteria bacterium]|nr:hypothetical protein [Candidatus Daviesbacteria bacterium]
MRQKIWIILGIGILFRLLASPFTYHSDIQTYDLATFVLQKGYILSFYDFFPNLPSILGCEQVLKTFPNFNFNYPPAVYFFLGGISLIFSFLVGNNFIANFLFNTKAVLGAPILFFHLLTLKLPLLAFDIASAVLLTKLFSSPRQKLMILGMWMFNPIAIFASFFEGQFDIIPTFFTILSLFLLKASSEKVSEKKLLLSSLSLGIGATFKIYPLFLVIPLMSLTENWQERIKILIVSILPYLILILPFLPSHGFRSSALLAGQTLKSFYAQIPISGGESIILFLATLIFFYLLFFRNKISAENLWQRYLITLLIFFIFTHYHPQWLLWLTPFLIIEAALTNLKNFLAKSLIYISWFCLLFFFDPGLTLGLFSPIFPSLYNSISIWQILGVTPDYNFMRSIFQTIFVGSAVYYIYIYFRENR